MDGSLVLRLRSTLTASGECQYAAYQMAYVVNPPMLRTEVYLAQLITAVVFGLVMAALVCCNADKLSP